ncbi:MULTISPECIES: late competence development ComFB family protein [Thiorhodovibrio]|uniref:late competence development ComFB family protein n=1 Tax=Thiorhodovibrio TaxID=61593 RepID=UPI0019121F52|nr:MULTISPECIES: late competence development ComFB family protein [Thiorhodovibrio]MBK5970747.1 hypothetical protein [Thiorhodovibrio winogradskyi]WPL14565.1 Late competence development protein ComFB [Thiorhodovibrio litoralis]
MHPIKHNESLQPDDYEPMLSSITNSYEQLVLDQIFRISDEAFPEPPDSDLLADIMCLALNQLPARYVRHSVDFSAHLSSSDSHAIREQVAEAVAKAIDTINRRRTGER